MFAFWGRMQAARLLRFPKVMFSAFITAVREDLTNEFFIWSLCFGVDQQPRVIWATCKEHKGPSFTFVDQIVLSFWSEKSQEPSESYFANKKRSWPVVTHYSGTMLEDLWSFNLFKFNIRK